MAHSTEPALTPSLPRRDRIAILMALFSITLLAWVYLIAMPWPWRKCP